MKTINSGSSRGRTLLFSSGRNEVLNVEFERVVLPCLPSFTGLLSTALKNEAQDEDLVQETYLRLFRFFHKFELGTNCKV
ncbi:MAG: hypothetical protein HYU46_12795 [Deltaproteobacteria bacterium]|nr:hypothetical protein [Deltaproteobacteria bacterium]